jgi:hypothetical protein
MDNWRIYGELGNEFTLVDVSIGTTDTTDVDYIISSMSSPDDWPDAPLRRSSLSSMVGMGTSRISNFLGCAGKMTARVRESLVRRKWWRS